MGGGSLAATVIWLVIKYHKIYLGLKCGVVVV
jgi:hypothetical protein